MAQRTDGGWGRVSGSSSRQLLRGSSSRHQSRDLPRVPSVPSYPLSPFLSLLHCAWDQRSHEHHRSHPRATRESEHVCTSCARLPSPCVNFHSIHVYVICLFKSLFPWTEKRKVTCTLIHPEAGHTSPPTSADQAACDSLSLRLGSSNHCNSQVSIASERERMRRLLTRFRDAWEYVCGCMWVSAVGSLPRLPSILPPP